LTANTLNQDVRTIGLVALAHGLSHFFQIATAVLFPLIRDDLGVSYVALGGTVALYYVVSGVCQTAAGFAVDRYGARRVLFFGLALSNGAPFTLIGNDGGLLETSVSLAQIDMSPGERVDVIVDFRGLAVGSTVMLRDLRSGWDLLQFVVARTVNDTGIIPTTLSTIESLSNPVTARVFSFDGMSKINGQLYDINRIDFSVPFGQTELWRFVTNGNAPHPVHVHGASFQVVSRSGGRGQTYAWERGWKDTVLLDDLETVEVLIRFDAFRGLYVMHCHKLEHEDMGMMSNFEVV